MRLIASFFGYIASILPIVLVFMYIAYLFLNRPTVPDLKHGFSLPLVFKSNLLYVSVTDWIVVLSLVLLQIGLLAFVARKSMVRAKAAGASKAT